ncbi:metallophosphoesterase family protein [Mycolicibacterium sp. PDY-3]|uniref:metallophosphoesterase family protein n=1 Tax=Mycolicibacterium sp. PDY-3 TaxID=3376069 RepID=UPI0037A1E42F
MDLDYQEFVQTGQIASFISAVARCTGINDSEVSLLSLRSGCVIVVLRLPKAGADMLIRDGFDASTAGLTAAQVEMLNRVQRITEGDVVEAPFLRRKVPLDPDVSWLHLSDLHIDEDFDKSTSDTRADLERFLNDFPEQLEKAGIVPDMVFFTGDIAANGRAKQYKIADRFFQAVRDRLPPAPMKMSASAPKQPVPFFIVPGNHDVDWDAIDPRIENEMRTRLAEGVEYKDLPKDIRAHTEKRHKNYTRFAKANNESEVKWHGHAYSKCFQAGRRNISFGVAGFNSAWHSTRKMLLEETVGMPFSAPNLDLQHLSLGGEQIRSAKAEIANSLVRVALFHHPPESEWFRDSDRALQREELNFFDFVLRGHQHEPKASQSVRVAGNDDYIELAPAALRTRPKNFQGFMSVQLDFTQKLMRIRSWTVTNRARRWVPDQEFGDGGIETYKIPETLLNRIDRVSSSML